jgi:hypothetical protein
LQVRLHAWISPSKSAMHKNILKRSALGKAFMNNIGVEHHSHFGGQNKWPNSGEGISIKVQGDGIMELYNLAGNFANAKPTAAADQSSGNLSAIKEAYLQLELEIFRHERKFTELRDEIQQLAEQGIDLTERVQHLEGYDKKVSELQEKQRRLNLLEYLADKARIDAEIEEVREKKRQEITSLKRDYGITPEKAPGKWQELDVQSAAKQKELLGMPGADELKKRQEAIKREYIQMRQGCYAQTDHPESEPQKRHNHGHDKTLAERMALAKAERELQKAADPQLHPGKAQEQRRTEEKENEPGRR